VDYVCSELDTNGRKRDGSMLFEETAPNDCCSAEGGINPPRATHEMGCVDTQAVWFGLFYYWIVMKDVRVLSRSGSAIIACMC